MSSNITGERLKALRIEHDWSQSDVARMLNIDRVTYLNYEKGNSRPVRRLKELSDLFNVSTDYILGKTSDRNAQDSAQLHDLLEELFTDSPEILNTIKSINAEGKLQSTQGELKLSDTHKAFIKQSILLALKEAKAEQASVKTITIDLDENDKP